MTDGSDAERHWHPVEYACRTCFTKGDISGAVWGCWRSPVLELPPAHAGEWRGRSVRTSRHARHRYIGRFRGPELEPQHYMCLPLVVSHDQASIANLSLQSAAAVVRLEMLAGGKQMAGARSRLIIERVPQRHRSATVTGVGCPSASGARTGRPQRRAGDGCVAFE